MVTGHASNGPFCVSSRQQPVYNQKNDESQCWEADMQLSLDETPWTDLWILNGQRLIDQKVFP